MSNRLDMKKDTNNRKDKTKYDGPEKPDAYMGNDKQWVFRALVLAFIDMCIIAISFFFALMIRFEFSYSHIPLSFLEGYLHIVPLFMVISLVVFYIFRLYHSIWRFASINEFMHIIGAFLVLAVVSVTIHEVYEIKMPYAFWIIGLMLSFALCTACRFAYRFFRTGQKMLEQRGSANGDEKVMIIGAGNAGRMLIRELIMSSHLHTKACCIIDDNPAKLGRFIDGVPIVGNKRLQQHYQNTCDIIHSKLRSLKKVFQYAHIGIGRRIKNEYFHQKWRSPQWFIKYCSNQHRQYFHHT